MSTSLAATPNYLLKIIPPVEGSVLIGELVRYHLEEVRVRGAWTGPAALALFTHALVPLADCEQSVDGVQSGHLLFVGGSEEIEHRTKHEKIRRTGSCFIAICNPCHS